MTHRGDAENAEDKKGQESRKAGTVVPALRPLRRCGGAQSAAAGLASNTMGLAWRMASAKGMEQAMSAPVPKKMPV